MNRAARWPAYLLAAGLAALVPVAAAEITKVIRFESEPSGAAVYLLRGNQRERIGVTPFSYEAEFHSEMSVQRVAVDRAGYAPLALEISPSKTYVMAKLGKRKLVADAASHSDALLRETQTQLNPSLGELLERFLLKHEGVIDSGGLARVQRLAEAVYLRVPLKIVKIEAAKDGNAVAPQLWSGFGRELVKTLDGGLPSKPGLAGYVIEADLSAMPQFGVNSSVNTTVEMTCMPRTKQVYDTCATRQPIYTTECRNGNCTQRQTGTRCASGYVPQYDPCATRAPMTKRTVQTNPAAKTAHARIFAVAQRREPERTVLLQFDETGKLVFRDGTAPERLVAELRGK